jgi:hypothetical protein
VAVDLVMIAARAVDPIASLQLLGCSATVLGVAPVQRRRLRCHLQAIESRLGKTGRDRPPDL